MTMSETVQHLLDTDPAFRQQYQAMALAQLMNGTSAAGVQAPQEAPQQAKKNYAGIVWGVVILAVLVLSGVATYTFLDVSFTPVQQPAPTKPAQQRSNGGSVYTGASADEIVITATPDIAPTAAPTDAPVMTEKNITDASVSAEQVAVPVPTISAEQAAVIAQQAPHKVRGSDPPTATPVPTLYAVSVPTISAEQAAVIGAQKPHKVR